MGSESQLELYIYIYLDLCPSAYPRAPAHVQNGISGSYMDIIFEESEMWTYLLQFYQKILTIASRLAEFV